MPAVAPSFTALQSLPPCNSCYDAQIPEGQAKVGCMYYVYFLRSKGHPDQTYIGSTSNLQQRLSDHNSGKSIHTNKFKPWE